MKRRIIPIQSKAPGADIEALVARMRAPGRAALRPVLERTDRELRGKGRRRGR